VERIDDVASRITSLFDLSSYASLFDKVKAIPKLAPYAFIFPHTVKRAPCQEVVETEPDLDSLPILRCWPGDGGRFLTLPQVITRDPETGQQNMGMYRMQVSTRGQQECTGIFTRTAGNYDLSGVERQMPESVP
jgi:4-hydroxy-3-polyprenylbenzoate decarboxylase